MLSSGEAYVNVMCTSNVRLYFLSMIDVYELYEWMYDVQDCDMTVLWLRSWVGLGSYGINGE